MIYIYIYDYDMMVKPPTVVFFRVPGFKGNRCRENGEPLAARSMASGHRTSWPSSDGPKSGGWGR